MTRDKVESIFEFSQGPPQLLISDLAFLKNGTLNKFCLRMSIVKNMHYDQNDFVEYFCQIGQNNDVIEIDWLYLNFENKIAFVLNDIDINDVHTKHNLHESAQYYLL